MDGGEKAPEPVGPYWDTVEALSPEDLSVTVRYGLRRETVKVLFADAARRTPIAQYYGLVRKGMIIAKHAFKGLNRNLMYDGNMRADEDVLAYAWRPTKDVQWEGSPWGGAVVARVAIADRVLVVLVRDFGKADEFGVRGVIANWSWVEEDSELRHAPVDWKERYNRKMWTRGGL